MINKKTLAAMVMGIPLLFGGCSSTSNKVALPTECVKVETVGFEHGKLEAGCKTQRGVYSTYKLGSDHTWREDSGKYVMYKPVYKIYKVTWK